MSPSKKHPGPPDTRAPAAIETIGRKRATINDIARLAGVSKKTVSRVINESPFVKESTREKVAAIIREVGFSPDPQARGLAFRRSFLIGTIFNNPTAQYVLNLQEGILDAMRGTSFELVIRPCDRTSPGFLADMRAFVERHKLFGVILSPSASEDERLIALLDELDCPYVRIASSQMGPPETMIVTHDHDAAAAAAHHLTDLGHTRIAHISGPDTFRSAHQRRKGFTAGLAERGVKLPRKYDRDSDYTFEDGQAKAEALLSLDQRPTAIFAGNDEMAAGIYVAARKMGLRIPEDLSVVGYDDSPLAARLWPPLTSLRVPIREMGRIAAQRLIARGLQREADLTEAVRIVPSLVERGSTAPPPDA